MSERTIIHGTFVVERTYGASPTRVFAAWANPAVKAQWFGGSSTGDPTYTLDFHVGGREVNRGGPPGGPVYTYDARYQDIVPNRRIVYTYDMCILSRRGYPSLWPRWSSSPWAPTRS